MSLQFPASKRVPIRSLRMISCLVSLSFSLSFSVSTYGQDNAMSKLNCFDNAKLVDNPWGGVNNGVLTVLQGYQKAVSDSGSIAFSNPGPSIAVGDLNGDGLPDLVVADSKGFFWFYPNSGTPTQPKFTHGEVMPIWLSNPHINLGLDSNWMYEHPLETEDNTVPRIQLVDFDKDGKLDLVVGNYEGKLYYIHNSGSTRQPNFAMPQSLDSIQVPTYTKGLLWCNFLAPFLYDWRNSGVMDLLMGEGTYASNSIYLLTNKGTNDSPTFNEMNTVKIIPGLGREHLAPQVVDWNNDGKPDILTGERLGFINIFLNTTTDPTHPQFDQGQHVSFGGKENIGPFATAAVADLTSNKMPNLVLSSSDNRILYAENKGTPGNPQFGAPLPVQGTNPFPKILESPDAWSVNASGSHVTKGMIWKALGIPYVLLCCSNAQVDPDFKPPSPEIKSVLRYYTVPHQNATFPTGFYPVEDTQIIRYQETNNGYPLLLKPKTHYKLSFWVKVTGDIENLVYIMTSSQPMPGRKPNHHDYWISKPIESSSGWSQFTDDFSYNLDPDGTQVPILGFSFSLAFNGHPDLEVAGFEMKESGN